jgi:hypothetical protein
MSVATKSRKAKTDVSKANDSEATLDVSIGKATDPAPTAPTDPAPTLQESLDKNDAPTATNSPDAPTGPNGASVPKTIVGASGDPNTVEFMALVSELETTIRSQRSTLVSYFSERGKIVCHAIDVRLSKATNKATRSELRASAIRSLTSAAEGAYDPTSEPSPKLDRWITVYQLVRAFPNALKLPSVGVADAFGAVLTRVEPPKSWDSAERYELKRRYEYADVSDLIDRAVSEVWTIERTKAELEQIGGVVNPEPPADKRDDDPVKAARSLAESILERITDRKIDPETFFDALQAQLTKYGWTLYKGADPKGVETLKVAKTGRRRD